MFLCNCASGYKKFSWGNFIKINASGITRITQYFNISKKYHNVLMKKDLSIVNCNMYITKKLMYDHDYILKMKNVCFSSIVHLATKSLYGGICINMISSGITRITQYFNISKKYHNVLMTKDLSIVNCNMYITKMIM